MASMLTYSLKNDALSDSNSLALSTLSMKSESVSPGPWLGDLGEADPPFMKDRGWYLNDCPLTKRAVF